MTRTQETILKDLNKRYQIKIVDALRDTTELCERMDIECAEALPVLVAGILRFGIFLTAHMTDTPPDVFAKAMAKELAKIRAAKEEDGAEEAAKE